MKHECDICHKIGKTKAQFKKHKNIIHLQIRFSCDKCKHKATTFGNLKIHKISTHDGVKENFTQCDYKAYDKPSLLNTHKGRSYEAYPILMWIL